MAKMIDIEKLKPLLNGVLTEENEGAFIEGVMESSIDYDEEAIQSRIDEAANNARIEAQAEYSQKLHNMFFGNKEENIEKPIDDTKVDPEVSTNDNAIPDIWEEVK